MQIEQFLGVYQNTNSLAAAAINITAFNETPTWDNSFSSCAYTGSEPDNAFAVYGGLGRNDVTLDYDKALYSYAGCRCIDGYDNVYTFEATGRSAQ